MECAGIFPGAFLRGEKFMEIKAGVYRHFKGKKYQVLYLATHSETREPMVVYRALYGEYGIWVRPASMWAEHVERDGYSGPRFYPIEEEGTQK